MSSSVVLSPGPSSSSAAKRAERTIPIRAVVSFRSAVYLALAGINCLFQIAWFWHYTSHNINYDAVSYLGIARHVLDGDLHASLHGYWSPLISWCIATASIVDRNLLLDARIITIASFLACLPLVYLLSLRLWRSSTLASFTVLYFTLARGVVAFSVYFIGADFLLTAAVSGYFLLLLQCLREPAPTNWLKLGAVHAIAFLAKAFAMPWLALSTILAAFLLNHRNPKKATASTLAGLMIPLLTWAGWGMLLETKYGRFTAGYQSKWNLLSIETRNTADKGALSILADTSQSNDGYMVVDSMYPSSPLWNAHLDMRTAGSRIFQREMRNLPEATKQILILITPGGVLGLLLSLRHLIRSRKTQEIIWSWVVVCSTISLALAYCMLVFDDRYVLPVTPLLIVLAARFLVPIESPAHNRFVRMMPVALFCVTVVFFAFYWASPFRRLRRDYQTGVYAMSATLREIPHCDRLVAIGKGPFPEHGVGWEAGIYASYFAQCRIVGFSEELPSAENSDSAVGDIEKLRANSILLFGNAHNADYSALLKAIQENSRYPFAKSLQGSASGQIGLLLWK